MDETTRQRFGIYHRQSLPTLKRIREHLSGLKIDFEEDSDAWCSKLIVNLLQGAERLKDRLESGPQSPLLVAIIGATGTGKSKIFNSLLGSVISPSSFKRPTTRSPLIYGGLELAPFVERKTFFAGYGKNFHHDADSVSTTQDRQLHAVLDSAPPFNGLALIDTPDFDSVSAENRQVAADVFDRCDAVIFVTDAIKYADQVGWDYLHQIRTRQKTAVFLINRLRNPLSLTDFARRLREAGLDRPVHSLTEHPTLGDEDLLAATEPAIKEINRHLALWQSNPVDILINELAREWWNLKTGLFDRLLPFLAGAKYQSRQLELSLVAAGQHFSDNLASALSVTISTELKHSLLSQIQAQFQKWDILKYPRRIMTMPWTLLKDKVLTPLGVKIPILPSLSLSQEIDRLFAANREALVNTMNDYNQRILEIFNANQVGRALAARDRFTALPLPAATIREQYDCLRDELEAWVKVQAVELVKGLGTGEKVTFYLAQAVSMGVIIGIQVHTGGFSFFDGLIDGVLAPILSQLTGHALSREKVKAFEAQANQRHLAGCQLLLQKQGQAYVAYLDQARQGLAPAEALTQAAAELNQALMWLK